MGRQHHLAVVLIAVLCVSVGLSATVPPLRQSQLPAPILAHLAEHPSAFQFKGAFFPLVNAIHLNQRVQRLGIGRGGAAPPRFVGPTAITGTRRLPVLPVTYSDSGPAPFPKAALQRAVFDGPGAVTDYYRANSYGKFTLTGQFFDWQTVPEKESDYLGGTDCDAMCTTGRDAALVLDALKRNPNLDWSQFDNDGPDGTPNSGDDDGVVDAVVIVQPQVGAECGTGQHVWSHHGTLTDRTGAPFQTSTPRKGGGFIKVDDFIIVPATSCFGGVIEPGVFAHELGHTLGLPDLYSLNSANPSVGAGVWCLMGLGIWGGDGKSPSHPTGMSAWAKSFLGWITPRPVAGMMTGVPIDPVEGTATSFAASVNDDVYYLLERRQQTGVDGGLPGAGLLLWRVDDSIVRAGLSSNHVNWDPAAPGIAVVEADGHADLQKRADWGDSGDLFRNPPIPGVDGSTTPRLEGNFAICNLVADGGRADIGYGSCPLNAASPAAVPPPPVGRPQAAVPPSTGTPSTPLDLVGPGVRALAGDPSAYVGAQVRFTARIVNTGSNYFADRRLEVQDDDGVARFPVRVPGALSAVPAPRTGSDATTPSLLSDVLDGPVTLTGHLERASGSNSKSYVFVVEAARPIR